MLLLGPLLSILCLRSQVIFKTLSRSRRHYSCVTDTETEPQMGEVTCPKLHSFSVLSWDLKLELAESFSPTSCRWDTLFPALKICQVCQNESSGCQVASTTRSPNPSSPAQKMKAMAGYLLRQQSPVPVAEGRC